MPMSLCLSVLQLVALPRSFAGIFIAVTLPDIQQGTNFTHITAAYIHFLRYHQASYLLPSSTTLQVGFLFVQSETITLNNSLNLLYKLSLWTKNICIRTEGKVISIAGKGNSLCSSYARNLLIHLPTNKVRQRWRCSKALCQYLFIVLCAHSSQS